MTKGDELYSWCRLQGTFSSVDVRKWGLDNFYISADRMVRKWVEEGRKIRRLNKYEIQAMGLSHDGKAPIAWYIYDDGKDQFEIF